MIEHMKAGSIDKIDFHALPFGKGNGILHGYAAGNFFFVIGGDGAAIGHASLRRGHLRGMQQSGNQGGLATVRMPHYSYVADLTSLVRFHGFSLMLLAFMCGGNSCAQVQRRGTRQAPGTSCFRWRTGRAIFDGPGADRDRESVRASIGVGVAEEHGHRFRSAVYLAHAGLGPTLHRDWRAFRQSSIVKKRMLSQPECERPVKSVTHAGRRVSGRHGHPASNAGFKAEKQ